MPFDPYTYDLARLRRKTPSGAALAAEVLLAVPLEVRAVLWRGLVDALSASLAHWEQTPPGHRSAPPALAVQHVGKRRFPPAALRAQSLVGWHRLMGLELRLAADALEALLCSEAAVYRALLAEQCARVGQLYAELARRAGEVVAVSLVRWELRLLRYRASPALAALIYDS
jgi:hypothetical protein